MTPPLTPPHDPAVLYIEDDLAAASTVAAGLKANAPGLLLRHVARPEEADSLLERNSLRALLLGVTQRQEGVQAAAALHARRPDLPLVALCDILDRELVGALIAAGATVCAARAVNPRRLVAMLQ